MVVRFWRSVIVRKRPSAQKLCTVPLGFVRAKPVEGLPVSVKSVLAGAVNVPFGLRVKVRFMPSFIVMVVVLAVVVRENMKLCRQPVPSGAGMGLVRLVELVGLVVFSVFCVW